MKKVAVAFALVLTSLALVACGSSSSSSSSESTSPETTSESGAAAGGEEGAGQEAEGGSAGSASALDIETASSGLAYSSKSATAKAGMVTVDFTNSQAIPHDVAIEDSGGEVVGQTELTSEGSESTEVELKPGTYTYFCTVPGHREAGMEGTLTVK
ncbi:MAG: cupredoxin domain-containing protein [Solirubrobacterales bacterium]|nr:cupredoxin domain-containing protein [Solirubrobacterales bacterium]